MAINIFSQQKDMCFLSEKRSGNEVFILFEAEGQKFANILKSLEQFVWTVKGQNNFWSQNAFLTHSWRFLISNELEQLDFKL